MVDFSPGYFGKLPIYPDFIRHNATSREVSQLDQWFQEGIHFAKSRLGQGWADDFRKAESYNFLFQQEGSEYYLLGIYTPSRDQSGRLYPFFIFLRISKRSFDLPLYFAPVCFSPFLAGSYEIIQGGWEGTDLKSIVSRLEQMSAPLLKDFNPIKEGYLRYLKEQNILSLWRNIFNDFEHAGKYLITHNLTNILQPLRNHSLNRFGLGLKFPLSSRDQAETYDIPFWFDLVIRLLRQDKVSPVLFWNRRGSGNAPSMIAFLNQPSPKNFLLLIRPDMNSDLWYDLVPRDPAEIDRVLPKIDKGQKDLLDNGDISAGAFLAALEAGG